MIKEDEKDKKCLSKGEGVACGVKCPDGSVCTKVFTERNALWMHKRRRSIARNLYT